MKLHFSFIFFWIFCFHVDAQEITLVTWNIQDLGRTKSASELNQMANLLRDYDLVAIQEVVAKDPAGARAIATMADMLDRMGADWDYAISDPTQSPSGYISERYAFLWKTSTVRLLEDAYLDSDLATYCDREPYIGEFAIRKSGKSFYLVNFHARKFNLEPEKEINHFIQYPERTGGNPVLIAGDFNLDENHEVWRPFYQQGFLSALKNMPTTLKRSCDDSGEYFNYAIDNIYFQSAFFINRASGRIDFVRDCQNLSEARRLSDHLPVFLKFELK